MRRYYGGQQAGEAVPLPAATPAPAAAASPAGTAAPAATSPRPQRRASHTEQGAHPHEDGTAATPSTTAAPEQAVIRQRSLRAAAAQGAEAEAAAVPAAPAQDAAAGAIKDVAPANGARAPSFDPHTAKPLDSSGEKRFGDARGWCCRARHTDVRAAVPACCLMIFKCRLHVSLSRVDAANLVHVCE